jgi:hypothetical protein
MEGEVGLVTSRSLREKKRSYKDFLREEDEDEDEDDDLVADEEQLVVKERKCKKSYKKKRRHSGLERGYIVSVTMKFGAMAPCSLHSALLLTMVRTSALCRE